MTNFSKNRQINYVAQPLVRRGANSGFSLPGALIAIALVGITAAGLTGGLAFSRRAQNNITMKASFKDVVPALRSALAEGGRDFFFPPETIPPVPIIPPCGDPADTALNRLSRSFQKMQIASAAAGGAATMQLTTSPSASHPSQAEAAERCKSPKIGSFTLGSSGHTADYSYFCVNITADSNFKSISMASTKSIWAQENTFMEIMIMPVDLTREEPSTCADIDKPGRGLKIFYTAYFANLTGERNSNDQRVKNANKASGVFYVSRE